MEASRRHPGTTTSPPAPPAAASLPLQALSFSSLSFLPRPELLKVSFVRAFFRIKDTRTPFHKATVPSIRGRSYLSATCDASTSIMTNTSRRSGRLSSAVLSRQESGCASCTETRPAIRSENRPCRTVPARSQASHAEISGCSLGKHSDVVKLKVLTMSTEFTLSIS